MRTIYATTLLAGLCFSPLTLLATPQEQTVRFTIHETPSDPTSDVVFVMEMTLVPDSVAPGPGAGGLVGWEVANVLFTQVTGSGDVLWSEDYPAVDTLDGLWWVLHADMENPEIAELVLPPLIAGTAAPDDPNEDDLDYDFEGTVYTPPQPPKEPPYPVTASLTFTFQRAMEPSPFEEESDEPADSDGGIE